MGSGSEKALGCALELAGFGKGESGRDNNHRGDVGGGESAVPLRSVGESVSDWSKMKSLGRPLPGVRTTHQSWPVPTGGEAGRQPRSSPSH